MGTGKINIENTAPYDKFKEPMSPVARSASVVIGREDDKARLDQAGFTKELGGIRRLSDVLVRNVNFNAVVLSKAAGVELGKGVTFYNCGLSGLGNGRNGLKIKGGEASLVRFVNCTFDKQFLDGFEPDIAYGVEFVVQENGPLHQLVQDFWREGRLRDYVEIGVVIDPGTAREMRAMK